MGANGRRSDGVAEEPEREGGATVFRGTHCSLPRTTVALALWLGPSTSTPSSSSPHSSSSPAALPPWLSHSSSSSCSCPSTTRTNGAARSQGSYAGMQWGTSRLVCIWRTTRPSIPTGLTVAFLRSRKGFVKIAMQSGCPLVPVFCFGQSYAFKWWRPGGKLFVNILEQLNLLLLSYGEDIGTSECRTPIPFPTPIHVVVGRPIELMKNPQPTIDEINEVHEQFVGALQELFEKYKTKTGYPSLHLRVL